MELLKRAALELLYAAGQGTIPCLFRILTGLYCPGCGGTRALKALLHGNLCLSFCYHPLVPYLAFFVPVLLLHFIYCRKKKKTFSRKLAENVLRYGIIVLIGNWILKNACLLFFGNDLLALLDEWRLMGAFAVSVPDIAA